MSSLRKTIGILSWDFATQKGGLGRAMQDIARTLAAGGYGVEHLQPSGFSVKHQLLYSFRLPKILPSFASSRSLDAVIFPTGPGGVFLPRSCGLPSVAIVYHTYVQQARDVPLQWWKRAGIPAERRTIRSANMVLCYARETFDVLLQDYGVDPHRLRLLPQIFPLDRWNSSTKKVPGLCVCVARLEQRKNVKLLLRAWPALQILFPKAKLVIVGDGYQRRSVDRHIRRLSGVERVAALPESELRDLVGSAELMLCPSYLEGFGLAAAESFLAGTTVIAADSDGLRSLLGGGERGMLLSPHDSTIWAAAIVELLGDRQKRETFAKAGRQYILRQHDQAAARAALLDAIAGTLQ